MSKIETDVVKIHNEDGSSSVVLICEHASTHIPAHLDNLGLQPADRHSHAAWDPGALAVALHLSDLLDAKLVYSSVSRLVYDCNRPPTASDAMPARSEVIEVPANANLSETDRKARAETYYHPFRRTLQNQIAATPAPAIVTIHSFTPVYHGEKREVEIGILHDTDTRLANAMLDCAADHTDASVDRNAPYGPEDGVTHTLKEHALPHGHLNVMIEVRNDLIGTDKTQFEMAKTLAQWITAALSDLDHSKGSPCVA